MTASLPNDALNNLFAGDTGEVRTTETVARAPVSYVPAVERFEEKCLKCNGGGKFISYSGRILGDCFACKGAGKKVFKSSADDRAKSRVSTAARKADRAEKLLQGWINENPAAYAWLVATAPRWEIAQSLLDGLNQYGDLTPRQMTIISNGIARDAARTAERAQKAAEAPAVDTAGIDRLKAAFDHAVAYSAEKGLKLSPRITIGGLTISPAKASSANAGALYVKQSGDARAYLGKIQNGKFFATAAAYSTDVAAIQALIADPADAAKVYGQTTGTCCICNATLISKWKHKGIGPICAEKFGW